MKNLNVYHIPTNTKPCARCSKTIDKKYKDSLCLDCRRNLNHKVARFEAKSGNR